MQSWPETCLEYTMNIATFGGEKSVNDLAKRVFHLPARTSNAQLKRLAESLMLANPGLHHLKDWSDGAPILVPQLPGFQAASSSTLFDLASEGITEEAIQALAQLRKTVAVAAKQNLADTEAVLELLKSKPVKESAAKLTDVKALVSELNTSVKARHSEFKTGHSDFEKVLADLAHGMKVDS
jgi:cell division septum initiation protein DivIVA